MGSETIYLDVFSFLCLSSLNEISKLLDSDSNMKDNQYSHGLESILIQPLNEILTLILHFTKQLLNKVLV
jgi:hypothetical protein